MPTARFPSPTSSVFSGFVFSGLAAGRGIAARWVVRPGSALALTLVAVIASQAAACASQTPTIRDTAIPDTSINRQIIETVERYRVAVESKDIDALLLMASQDYREDAGTPSGRDDYGFEGLRDVLRSRFQKATDIRYALRYVQIYRRCEQSSDPASNDGCRAYVDVLIDASFSIDNATGGKMRPDMRDQNQLVLKWDDGKWKFLSGM